MAEELLQTKLPPPWSYGVTSDGRVFFINENDQSTSWLHPGRNHPVLSGLISSPDLPRGWERAYNKDTIPYYVDHVNQRTTFRNPVSGETDPRAMGEQQPTTPHSQELEESHREKSLENSRKQSKKKTTKQTKAIKKGPEVKRNSEAPVTIKGWLQKLDHSGPLKSWKKKWFVLTDYCLFYYKGEDEREIQGSLLLPSYKISLCKKEDGINKKFAFKAEHHNIQTTFLAADSDLEMNKWVNALSLASLLQKDPSLMKEFNNNNPQIPSDSTHLQPFSQQNHPEDFPPVRVRAGSHRSRSSSENKPDTDNRGLVLEDPNFPKSNIEDPDMQKFRYQDPRHQDPRYQNPRHQDPRYQDSQFQDPRNQDLRNDKLRNLDPKFIDSRYQEGRFTHVNIKNQVPSDERNQISSYQDHRGIQSKEVSGQRDSYDSRNQDTMKRDSYGSRNQDPRQRDSYDSKHQDPRQRDSYDPRYEDPRQLMSGTQDPTKRNSWQKPSYVDKVGQPNLSQTDNYQYSQSNEMMRSNPRYSQTSSNSYASNHDQRNQFNNPYHSQRTDPTGYGQQPGQRLSQSSQRSQERSYHRGQDTRPLSHGSVEGPASSRASYSGSQQGAPGQPSEQYRDQRLRMEHATDRSANYRERPVDARDPYYELRNPRFKGFVPDPATPNASPEHQPQPPSSHQNISGPDANKSDSMKRLQEWTKQQLHRSGRRQDRSAYEQPPSDGLRRYDDTKYAPSQPSPAGSRSSQSHPQPQSSPMTQPRYMQQQPQSQRGPHEQRKYFEPLTIDTSPPFEQDSVNNSYQQKQQSPSPERPVPAEYRTQYVQNLAETATPHTRHDMLTAAEMEKRRLQEPPVFRFPEVSPKGQSNHHVQDEARYNNSITSSRREAAEAERLAKAQYQKHPANQQKWQQDPRRDSYGQGSQQSSQFPYRQNAHQPQNPEVTDSQGFRFPAPPGYHPASYGKQETKIREYQPPGSKSQTSAQFHRDQNQTNRINDQYTAPQQSQYLTDPSATYGSQSKHIPNENIGYRQQEQKYSPGYVEQYPPSRPGNQPSNPEERKPVKDYVDPDNDRRRRRSQIKDDDVLTAAQEMKKLRRKSGDYSKSLQEKEKNRLDKYIVNSFKRLSLGNELGNYLARNDEPDSAGLSPERSAYDWDAHARRSLDWEAENKVFRKGKSLLDVHDDRSSISKGTQLYNEDTTDLRGNYSNYDNETNRRDFNDNNMPDTYSQTTYKYAEDDNTREINDGYNVVETANVSIFDRKVEDLGFGTLQSFHYPRHEDDSKKYGSHNEEIEWEKIASKTNYDDQSRNYYNEYVEAGKLQTDIAEQYQDPGDQGYMPMSDVQLDKLQQEHEQPTASQGYVQMKDVHRDDFLEQPSQPSYEPQKHSMEFPPVDISVPNQMQYKNNDNRRSFEILNDNNSQNVTFGSIEMVNSPIKSKEPTWSIKNKTPKPFEPSYMQMDQPKGWKSVPAVNRFSSSQRSLNNEFNDIKTNLIHDDSAIPNPVIMRETNSLKLPRPKSYVDTTSTSPTRRDYVQMSPDSLHRISKLDFENKMTQSVGDINSSRNTRNDHVNNLQEQSKLVTPEAEHSSWNKPKIVEEAWQPKYQSQTAAENPKHEMGAIKEDPDMADSDVLADRKLTKLQESLNGIGLRLSIAAEDLLGKSHEELVLLLIQLRRAQSRLDDQRSYYRAQLTTNRPLEKVYKERRRTSSGRLEEDLEESHEQFQELRGQSQKVETQMEVNKPLVNLVDNLVTMGSLYGGDNVMLASQYKKERLRPGQEKEPKKLLDFSRQYQEERLVKEQEQELAKLSEDEIVLEEKLQELFELDKALQARSIDVTSLQEDREMLEKALNGVLKQENQETDSFQLRRLNQQRENIEAELLKVRQQLAESSRHLEETATENAKVEQEVILLRKKVYGISKSQSSPTLTTDSMKTRHQLERELDKVNSIMTGLSVQGQKLSQAMNAFRHSNPDLTGSNDKYHTSPQEKGSDTQSTWQSSQIEMSTHSYPQEAPVYKSTSSFNFTARPFESSQQQKVPSQKPMSEVHPQTRQDINSSSYDNHQGFEQRREQHQNDDLDENTKRFYGLIPKEKPRNQTVRDVKKQSTERRSRDSSRRGPEDIHMEVKQRSRSLPRQAPPERTDLPVRSSDDMFKRRKVKVQDPERRKSAAERLFPANAPTGDPVRRLSNILTPRPFMSQSYGNSQSSDEYSTTNQSQSYSQYAQDSNKQQYPPARSTTVATVHPVVHKTETQTFSKSEILRDQKYTATVKPMTVNPNYKTPSQASMEKLKARRGRNSRYMTISSSSPVKMETPHSKKQRLHSVAGDLISGRMHDGVPQLTKSSSVREINFDDRTIDAEVLFAPEKVEIPERYIPESDEEEPTYEELRLRQEKAQKIRSLLAKQSLQEWGTDELGHKTHRYHDIHDDVVAEQKRRERVLDIRQALAREVTVKSKQVAAVHQRSWSQANSPSDLMQDDYDEQGQYSGFTT